MILTCTTLDEVDLLPMAVSLTHSDYRKKIHLVLMITHFAIPLLLAAAEHMPIGIFHSIRNVNKFTTQSSLICRKNCGPILNMSSKMFLMLI